MRKFATLTTAMTLAIVGLFAATERAQALSCGETISVDTTLTTNLGPCAGPGLIIDTANVTLDLNKKSIIGGGACPADPDCFMKPFVPQLANGTGVLVDGVPGVTIKNGTIKNSFFDGILIAAGSHGTLVENMTLKDDLVFAVRVASSDDVVVRDNKMQNIAGNGMEFGGSDNFTVANNSVDTAGKARQVQGAAMAGECGVGNGIFVGGSQGAQILNNTFRDISQSAILLWPSDDALIDGNKVSASNFLPCISTDFGAISLVNNTNTVVSNNFVIANDNLETGNNSAIGLSSSLDVQINHNRLQQNGSGFFIRNSTAGTTIHNNCIVRSVTGVGLLADGSDPVVNAENNFWDASDGPSGVGPGGGALGGSGEAIQQSGTGAVDVEPFLSRCFATAPK